MGLAYYLPRRGIAKIEPMLDPSWKVRVITDGGSRYLVTPGLLWLLRGRLAIISYNGGPRRGYVIEERVKGLLDDDVLIGRDGPAPVGVLRTIRGLGSSDGEVVG